MVKKLLGKKLGMIRFFMDEGRSIAATILQVGPCTVIQKKTNDRDGYESIQIGFESQNKNRVNRPRQGHFKPAGDTLFKYLKEIRVENIEQFELGQEIRADVFSVGEMVTVTGKSKGRGFSGVIKRWGFSGGKDTHGCRSHRVPGSIGSSSSPSRVFKGKKMPGRMGYHKTTVKNLKVLDVRPEMNMIAIKGAVPGSRNSIIEIKKVV